MDSTQDSFTRRMLRRASTRKNWEGGSLRSSSVDSRRKSSIWQAIDDQGIKIADVADSQVAGETRIGENTLAVEKGRSMSKANRTTSDSLISRRRDLPNGNLRSQRSSSHLIGQSRVNADCQNSQYLRESSDFKSAQANESNSGNAAAALVKIPQSINGNQEIIAEEGIPATNAGGCGYSERRDGSDFERTSNSKFVSMTENLKDDAMQLTPTYVKGFELGNVKWRGPLYTAYAGKRTQNKKDDRIVACRFDSYEGVEPSLSPRTPEEPKLVTTVQKEIWSPPKMKAVLNKQETINDGVESLVNNSFANKRPDKISLFRNTKENSDSSCITTPLTAEIKRLDAEIRHLEFHPSFYTAGNVQDSQPVPDRIYSSLSKIKLPPTGYSPKILHESVQSSDPDVFSNEDRSNVGEYTTPPRLGANAGRKNVRGNSQRITNAETESIDGNINNKGENGKFKPNPDSTRQSSRTEVLKETESPLPRKSTISSVNSPPTSPGNAGTSSTPNEKTLDLTAPYDVENFLADALGDEPYNTAVTHPPSENISQFNASELISEERTPIVTRRPETFLRRAPMTEPSPRHTGTFDRTMTIYRSLTQRIKNKLRPGLKSLPKTVAHDEGSMAETISEDKKIQALSREANIQHTLMHQANKALTLCRSTKEFFASTEQVEFERLLLIAGLRKAAAIDELRRLQNCESNNNNNNNDRESNERGEVTIKDFSLTLREDALDDESRHGDFVQWFVIAVSHGETVWATRPISCPVQSPRIIFSDAFVIPNLTPNFRITVSIYSLKLRRATVSHDDKYHLNKAERHSRCPSPKKPRLRRTDRSLSAVRNSSFVLSGMLEIFLHDLTLAAPWPLTSLVPGSVLRGTIDLTLSCQLHLSVSHSGFVTHGEEAGGFASWNRRWCVLQGRMLMFWNYPCDQEDKEPLATIDLAMCISSEIGAVDRSLCAKPRTLLIETTRPRSILDRNSLLLECRLSYTIVRNLLCCDTAGDLSQWKSKLNHVVTALHDWNITSRLPREQVSDL